LTSLSQLLLHGEMMQNVSVLTKTVAEEIDAVRVVEEVDAE
jgi:hypothetical protein